MDIGHYPHHSVQRMGISMESVVIQLVGCISEDHKAAGHSNGQSGNAYRGINFVFFYDSHRSFEIIFNHHYPELD
jgi:hypothetical protein